MARNALLAVLFPSTISLLAHTATAVPSQLVRRDLTPESSCYDLQNYQGTNGGWLTSDMWNPTAASDYLADWWNFNYGNGNFAADFARPWGIGQSFSCRFSTPCARPDCNTISNPGNAEAGPAYEVLVSLSNINNFLVTLRQGLEQSRDQWSSLQVAIQQKFWPNVAADDLLLKDVLAGTNALLGMAASIAGGPIGGAAAALFGGAVAIIGNSLSSTDKSLEYLAKMETAADSWYKGIMGTLNVVNDDIMSIGHHNFPDGSVVDIQPILKDGTWVDYRNIPILNTDASKPRVSYTELNQLFYNMLLSKVINYSWKQQATFIVKYDMTQEEFDSFESPSGSNDGRLKLYYGGSAFFFQGYQQQPGHVPQSQNPPGWGDLEGETSGGVTPQDVLRSSADAWHDSGFGVDFKVESAGTADPGELKNLGAKARGFWNIPVCVPPGITDLDGLKGVLDAPGEYYSMVGPKLSAWCHCKDTVDGSGKVFKDQFPSWWGDSFNENCQYDPDVQITYGGGV